jgi:hypothetical protein
MLKSCLKVTHCPQLPLYEGVKICQRGGSIAYKKIIFLFSVALFYPGHPARLVVIDIHRFHSTTVFA